MKKHIALSLGVAVIGLASPALAQSNDPCDRACLIDLADDYTDTLVGGDANGIGLADNAVILENLMPIAPGEGLWSTITGGKTDFQVVVPDPVSHQVGILTVMMEGETPVLVGVRLKVDGGKIVEAEHLVARELGEGQLANLQTPRTRLMQPVDEEYADSRGRLKYLGQSYYHALDLNNSNLSNMADDCERHENGFQTARNPMDRPTAANAVDTSFAYLGGLGCAAQIDTNMWEYISTINNRRVDIVDEVTGLVWGMSHFEHDFAKQDFALIGVPGTTVRHMEYNAFDMPAIHIYKVWGGAIHEIEALGIVVDYKSPRSFEKKAD